MRNWFLTIATLAIFAAACSGGPVGTRPEPNATGYAREIYHRHASAISAIPLWKSSFTYAGKSYSFEMIGTSPFVGAATTTVANQIIPLSITFSDGKNFQPGSGISVFAASPIFTNASYGTVGDTQFGDAVLRSEFWKYVAGTNYHVLLGPPTIEPVIPIVIPSSEGHAITTGGVTTGYITFSYFMSVVETSVIQKLNVKPSSLSFFATSGVKLLEAGNYCCYNGYHNELPIATQSGSSFYATIWGPVASYKSVDTMSHEVAEWLNDPFYTNVVPPWVQPGETACGGDLLEVGDPVTNHTFTVNGYSVQDIALYSWFSRDVPSIGIIPSTGASGYDLLGDLAAPATNCNKTPSPSPTPSPTATPRSSPTPSQSPSPKPLGRVDVDPRYIKFTHVGRAFTRRLFVSQSHFDGVFTRHGTCKGKASIRLIDETRGRATYEVTPRRAGHCVAIFLGGNPRAGTLHVDIAPH